MSREVVGASCVSFVAAVSLFGRLPLLGYFPILCDCDTIFMTNTRWQVGAKRKARVCAGATARGVA